LYNTINRTKRLDVGIPKDLETYDAIINNPNCSIIREIKEKITQKEVNEDGNITNIKEYLILIVTYQEKILME
jgi:hypothetical protein